MIEPVTVETLQEKAYKAIRDSIIRNDFLPGDPLSIDELSRKLGVSPTPVREALARLISDGLAERTPNRTACVTEITEEDVRQDYEVRQLMEPYVTAVAARKSCNAPDLRKRLAELREKSKMVKRAVESGHLTPSLRQAHRSIGLELNEIVLDALEQEFLKRIFSLMSDHSLRIRLFTESAAIPPKEQSLATTTDEHLAIIEALLAGEERGAEEAVRKHLRNAERRTLEASSTAASRSLETEGGKI